MELVGSRCLTSLSKKGEAKRTNGVVCQLRGSRVGVLGDGIEGWHVGVVGDGSVGSRVGVCGSPWSSVGGMTSTAEVAAGAKSVGVGDTSRQNSVDVEQLMQRVEEQFLKVRQERQERTV